MNGVYKALFNSMLKFTNARSLVRVILIHLVHNNTNNQYLS